eukprot:gene2955-3688_t
MTITAQQINQLRQRTGAGMMDCKKALTEAQGDMDQAIELLRKKGQKIAAARAERNTAEGFAVVSVNEKSNHGVVLALSCETDFVAKNDLFQQLAQRIATQALEKKAHTEEEVKALVMDGITIQEHIAELIGKMGENIRLSGYQTVTGAHVVPYLHTGSKLAVLVALAHAPAEQVTVVGKNIAMHIAALKPLAIDAEHSLMDTCEQEDCCEDMNPCTDQFLQEKVLLHQPFVKDSSITVKQYLESVDKDCTIVDFARVEVGEEEKGVAVKGHTKSRVVLNRCELREGYLRRLSASYVILLPALSLVYHLS